MTFLITGSSGQLAREFAARFERDGIAYAAPRESELDITDPAEIQQAIAHYQPKVLLNCAAYNHVDKAEADPAAAYAVNAVAVQNLAQACRNYGILLVHYSTDYVFDGRKEGLYVETDPPNPLNVYGQSKLEGERFAAETESLTFRVSWVYGPGEQNFLFKLRQWAEKSDVLKVVWDQISVPTYTADIVEYSLRAVSSGLRGTYHLTNSGYASRYEVARTYLQLIGCREKIVLPVASVEFGNTVARPFFSPMTGMTLSNKLRATIPSWQDALGRFVAAGRLPSTAETSGS